MQSRKTQSIRTVTEMNTHWSKVEQMKTDGKKSTWEEKEENKEDPSTTLH